MKFCVAKVDTFDYTKRSFQLAYKTLIAIMQQLSLKTPGNTKNKDQNESAHLLQTKISKVEYAFT